MEEVTLAVGEMIGHGCVKSAARMKSAVVLFVENTEQVNKDGGSQSMACFLS